MKISVAVVVMALASIAGTVSANDVTWDQGVPIKGVLASVQKINVGCVPTADAQFATAQVNQPIRIGAPVLSSEGEFGTVTEIFADGHAKAHFNGHFFATDTNVKDLYGTVPCFKNICVNNKVIERSGAHGTVYYVFTNGQAAVDIGEWNWTFPHVADLVKE